MSEMISVQQFYEYLFTRSTVELDQIILHATEYRSKCSNIRKASVRKAVSSTHKLFKPSRASGKLAEGISFRLRAIEPTETSSSCYDEEVRSDLSSDESEAGGSHEDESDKALLGCDNEASELEDNSKYHLLSDSKNVTIAHMSEGVVQYGSKWVKGRMSNGVTDHRCIMDTCTYNLQPPTALPRKWSEFELAALPHLVQRHTTKPYWSDCLRTVTKERVDWAAVGKELNRGPQDCTARWKLVLASRLKDPFTREEDVRYKKQLIEWGCTRRNTLL